MNLDFWPILQYQDIAKNLTKGQFAQNLKNRSDTNEHAHIETQVQVSLKCI